MCDSNLAEFIVREIFAISKETIEVYFGGDVYLLTWNQEGILLVLVGFCHFVYQAILE
jgi:hypothetical protein